MRLRLRATAIALLTLLAGAVSSQPPEPAPGMLLVASPELPDPNFAHSVVLLLHYDEGGAAGVIVNRPIGLALADALPEIPELAGRHDLIHFGGPVDPNALILLVHPPSTPDDADEVLPGVFTIQGVEALRPLLAAGLDEASVRAFAGYAGWAPGQLDAEIERGDWHLYPGTAARVFSDQPEELWKTLHRNATSPIA